MTSLPLVMTAPKRGKAPTHWLDLDQDAQRAVMAKLGLPGFRADQIAKHVFERCEDDPERFTDLPQPIRSDLKTQLFPDLLQHVTQRQADAGQTIKTLWRLHDGALLESVLMRYPGRSTLCISSQAGCGMACPFCATGQGGLTRNLSRGEIAAQLLKMNQTLRNQTADGAPSRISNIVFMGMGEPLANYNSVLAAIRSFIAPPPTGFGMSARGITVSTVGLVPQIHRLAGEGLPVTLAVSLHAATDELRNELVPINTRWPLHDVVDAAWEYAKTTKRRVSIEYAMMRDINDSVDQARRLAALLRRRGDWGWFHVNLIPLNPTPGSKWTASRKRDEKAFIATLTEQGVPVTLRDTRGQEIDGACGQLAASELSASQ
ncbi:MAG: 23S rRNA (adenine(2503)-C(2))-methyltransferase RlmN [Arachnia propionica]|nr:MAG: 23S rRNA (adenine(2503)-C(2))-methyltransferase RlmN [Arachnia propionica]